MSFLLRVWREPQSSDRAIDAVRIQARELATGRETAFADFEGLTAFLQDAVHDMGGPRTRGVEEPTRTNETRTRLAAMPEGEGDEVNE